MLLGGDGLVVLLNMARFWALERRRWWKYPNDDRKFRVDVVGELDFDHRLKELFEKHREAYHIV